MSTPKTDRFHRDENLDPLSKEPGAHPLATGAGAAMGGFAAGAAAGALLGPLGAAAGAVVGGILGGLAGHEMGEQFDPTSEEAYWRENFRSQPYVPPEANYEHYHPAYKFGWDARNRSGEEVPFETVEPELEVGWTTQDPAPHLDWTQARPAVMDAWHRIERARRRGEAIENQQQRDANPGPPIV